METFTTRAEIRGDGSLTLQISSRLPPGPVTVLVALAPADAPAGPPRDWGRLYGLGREVWHGVDADQYIRELRRDREDPDEASR